MIQPPQAADSNSRSDRGTQSKVCGGCDVHWQADCHTESAPAYIDAVRIVSPSGQPLLVNGQLDRIPAAMRLSVIASEPRALLLRRHIYPAKRCGAGQDPESLNVSAGLRILGDSPSWRAGVSPVRLMWGSPPPASGEGLEGRARSHGARQARHSGQTGHSTRLRSAVSKSVTLHARSRLFTLCPTTSDRVRTGIGFDSAIETSVCRWTHGWAEIRANRRTRHDHPGAWRSGKTLNPYGIRTHRRCITPDAADRSARCGRRPRSGVL